MQVIDSLVVELGLDSSKFNKNQKDAIDQLRKFQQGSEKVGRDLEASEKKQLGFFTSLKTAMAGIFAGAGLAGVTNFVNGMQRMDAQTSRTSRQIRISAGEIKAWESASKQMGGSGQGTTAALVGMEAALQDFLLTGQQSFLPLLNEVQVGLKKQNGQLKDAGELYLEVADAINKMYPNDPSRRASLLGRLPGMNQETIDILIRGRQEAEGLIAAGRELNNVNDQGAASAEKYVAALGRMGTAWESLKRTIVTTAAPGAAATMEVATDVLDIGNKKGWWEIFQQGLRSTVNGWMLGFKGGLGGTINLPSFAPPAQAAPSAPAIAPPVAGLTRADRNNNPGNIKFGAFARRNGATSADPGGFAIFPDREAGFRAAEMLLNSSGYRNLTLPQIGARWAEGDANWARNASRATGIPMDRPLTDSERTTLARRGTVAAEGSRLGAASGGSGPVNHSSVSIGSITVVTQATDAEGIANDIGNQLKRARLAAPANGGQQ